MNFQKIARAVVEHIAHYNAVGILLDSVYMFITTDGTRAEFTTRHDFTTLDDAILFGTLAEIDPGALITTADVESAFVVDCVAEMLEDIEDTLEITPQYHLGETDDDKPPR